MNIRHDQAGQRFVVDLEGEQAVLQYRPLGDGRLDYYRTFVPPAQRGKGVATRLVEHALEYALERGVKVLPSCPFVGDVIEANPRWAAVATHGAEGGR